MAVMPMSSSSQAPGHIEITETLLRLYVFLAQYLDRCQDDTIRKSFPESELQVHLSATRSRILEILSVNRVVKGKVEQECERILSLGAGCLISRGQQPATEVGQDGIAALKAERTILQNKTIALSDLLAVFRAHG
jgi:hypothetical protein